MADDNLDIARQRAIAQANARLRLGQQNTESVDNSWTGWGKEALRSVGEGIASIPDLVLGPGADMVTLAKDLAHGAQGPKPILGATPARSAYNEALPVTPGYENSWTREVGNVAGPAIVTAGAGAMPVIVEGGGSAILPAASRALAQAGVTTGAVTAGQTGGGKLGETLGGEPGRAIGETVGSLAGGFAPSAIVGAGYRGLKNWLTDAGSAARLAAADKLKVPPSLGLVGNKTAGVIEDSTAGIPFAGGPAYDARRAQFQKMDAAARDIAAARRGGPATGPINEASIGGAARDLAKTAVDDAQHGPYGVDQVFGSGLSENVGRDTVLPINAERARLEALSRDPTIDVATQRPTIQHFRDMLEQNARYPVDPGVEAALQARRAQALAAQQALPEAQRASVQPALDMIDEQIARNRGVTWQVGLNQRNYGSRTDTGVALDSKMREEIRNAQTETLRDAAATPASTPLYDAQGNPVSSRTEVNPVSFNLRNVETARLKDQQELLQPIVDAPGQGEAYNRLFSTTGKRNLDQLSALQEHVPNELAQVFADQFERQTRGPAAAGVRNASPETFRPRQASDWWASQPPEAKDVYAPPGPTRAKADALAEVAAADARRPNRTLPGAGGNTLGAPATLFQNPAIIAAIRNAGIGGAAGSFFGIPGAVGGAIIPSIPSAVAYGMGKAMTSPNFVRKVVNPPPLIQQRDLGRILAAAIASQQSR